MSGAEHEILDRVSAIERATESIERLATSIHLTDSVNPDLVALMAHAEHDVEHDVDRLEHPLGFLRRRKGRDEKDS